MENQRSYFVDRSRQYLRDLIEHLLENSDAVIYLEGVHGSGRSAFLNWIQDLSGPTLPLGNIQVTDDIDLLDDDQWQQLSENHSNQRQLVTGLPGSYRELTKRGFFADQTIERITMAPFARDDAELFLAEHCPSLSALTRQRLMNHCRLYPGELLLATYNTELHHSGLNQKRKALLWLCIPATFLALLWGTVQRFHLMQESRDQISAAGSSAMVIRAQDNNQQPATDNITSILTEPSINGSSTEQDASSPPELEPAAVSQPLLPFQPEEPTITPEIRSHTPVINQALVLDRQQILDTDRTAYSLQLMLATDPKNVDLLILNSSVQSGFLRYAKLVNNQVHYCLLYGVYSNLEQAGDALLQLPKSIQVLQPFRRNFAEIHQDIQSQSLADLTLAAETLADLP